MTSSIKGATRRPKQENTPQRQEQLEVRWTKLNLYRTEIIDKAGEEPEERLLLKRERLVLVVARQHQHEDRQDLREVVHLRLVVVHTRRVSVILDDVRDQPGHRVQRLECVLGLADLNELDVAGDAGFGTDAEEERGEVFDLEDALLRELGDERNEALLGVVGALEDTDPLLEPAKELLTEVLVLGTGGRLTSRGGFRSGSRPPDASEVRNEVNDARDDTLVYEQTD